MTLVYLNFQVEEVNKDAGDAVQEDVYRVRFVPPDAAALEAFFTPDSTQLRSKLADLRDQVGGHHDISFVGQTLWSGLLSEGIEDAVRRLYEVSPRPDFLIRLSVPDKLLEWPWESLYVRDIGQLALTDKPAFCIVHGPATNFRKDEMRAAGSPLRMLIIAPEGSGLAVGLEIEVIRHLAASRGIVPKVLDKGVSAQRIHDVLHDDGPWDIVHFIGHGRVNSDRRLDVVLNDDEGRECYVDAETWSASFDDTGVRLAVFNCCRSTGVQPHAETLSGLGPMMMRRGIPAVVSMRYDILDRAAKTFSNTFYDALFNGRCPGRVDLAMNFARGGLSRNDSGDQRAYITPVLHLAEKYEQLFTFSDEHATAINVPITSAPVEADRPFQLPEGLLAALRQRFCVPVIGPGVLRAGLRRRLADARLLGVSELVHALARREKTPYPRRRDLELSSAEDPADWINANVMQRVCQHHSDCQEGWQELIERVIDLYGKTAPSDWLLRIARMEVPGLFYTWIDGQLHDAVIKHKSTLDQVVWLFDDEETTMPKYETGRRPLVLVRGSVQDRATLVLTEDDHERLAVNISRMSPDLRNVARTWKRSVLFLGVSPRDPLVRQLAHQLLETRSSNRRQIQGRSYFVCPDHDAVDRAYWHQFDVEWITEDDLDQVLEAVIAAATPA